MGSELEALFPETRRALLAGFFRQATRQFYLREITRAIGKGHGSVQRELGKLVDAGILERTVEQGRTFFPVNPRSPIYPELHSLFDKTAGAAVVLREALGAISGVDVAFIFGSVAAGRQDPDSDVDLAVLGKASFRDVVLATGPAQQRLAREINPFVCTPEEFRRQLDRGEPFIRNVASGPKTLVIGTQDDLEELAG